MDAILWNIEQLGQSLTLHSKTTQGLYTQNMIGISVILRTLDPVQRFEHIFWIQQRWQRLQMYQKHIVPTLHAGPNYTPGSTHDLQTVLILWH